MTELAVGSAGTVTATFATDEDPVDATADVTVTVVDAFGTEIVAATTADHPDVGTYTVDVPAQTTPMTLTGTWSGTFDGATRTVTTVTPVVGYHLVTVAELRRKALVNIDSYPIETLRRARTQFANMAANHIGAPLVPTYLTVTTVGTGTDLIGLPKTSSTVVEASIDGTAVADTITVTPDGYARLANETWTYGDDVILGVVAGYDPTPPELVEAAVAWIEWKLGRDRSGMVDPRATSITGDLGTYRLSTPGGSTGRGAPTLTGLPEVDAALNAYRFVTVGR